MEVILARQSVGISELKANPNAVIEAAEGQPVALLNRNKPVAYIISPEQYEQILDELDELRLIEVIKARENERRVKVDIHAL
jgi:antitoxin StbD